MRPSRWHLAPHAIEAMMAVGIVALALVFAAAPVSGAETTRVLDRAAVIARFADAQSHFADIDGIALHYKDEGSGPAVLLVHGTLGDLSDWDGWMPALTRRHRVVRLDLPSFGLSGAVPSGNYSIDRYLSLVDALMDRLGIERFAIVGTSYGGLVAFRYAATRTDRITALVLVNSAGIETGRGPAAAASASASAPPLRNVFADPVITADDIEQNLRFGLQNPSRVTAAMVQRKLAAVNIAGRGEESVLGRKLYERGDPERVLAHVRAPSLVLWGGANKSLSVSTADAFAAALKNACSVRRVVVPEGGHNLIVDQPQASALAASDFLDHLTAPADCRHP